MGGFKDIATARKLAAEASGAEAQAEPQKPKSWRDVLPLHPACAAGRRMSEPELLRLGNDIKANGLEQEIVIWEENRQRPDGSYRVGEVKSSLLDGQNRLDAMELVGLDLGISLVEDGGVTWGDALIGRDHVMIDVVRASDEVDPWKLAASLNLHRRHDDAKQQADHAANLRERVIATAKAAPNKSIRQIAEATGTTHPTASRIIKDAQATGDVESAPRRTDTLGRQQPATKPAGTVRPPGTGNNEWYTPPEVIAAARAVLGGIDVDPASSETAQKVVQATTYFTAESDGLKQEWCGRVWLNPPYSRELLSRFVDKLLAEIDAGRVTEAIMLVNNCTDAGWFHAAERRCAHLLFSSGRIRFLRSDGLTPGAPTQGQAFFYFGQDAAGFIEAFSDICSDGRRLAEEVIGAIRRLPVDALRILDDWYLNHRGNMLERAPVEPQPQGEIVCERPKGCGYGTCKAEGRCLYAKPKPISIVPVFSDAHRAEEERRRDIEASLCQRKDGCCWHGVGGCADAGRCRSPGTQKANAVPPPPGTVVH